MTLLAMLLSLPVGVGAGLYFHTFAAEDSAVAQVGGWLAGLAEASPLLPAVALLGLSGGAVSEPMLGLAAVLILVPRLVRSTRRELRRVDPGLRLAAEGLGATPWEALRTVVLPQARPRLVGSVLRDLARTAGELAPFFVFAVALNASGTYSEGGLGWLLGWVVAANRLATWLERR